MVKTSEDLISHLKFLAKGNKFSLESLTNLSYGDNKQLWFSKYPLGFNYPIHNLTPGQEIAVMNAAGEYNGLKLSHPSPAEMMEIVLSKEGKDFVKNVLFTPVEASILADRSNRVNNGLIVEKTANGYVAREIRDVKFEDRRVPSEFLLIKEGLPVSAQDVPEGVREIYKTEASQELPLRQNDNYYFKKNFTGLLPSQEEMINYGALRKLKEEDAIQYAGRWDLYDDDFNRENLAAVSSYIRGDAHFGLSVFPITSKKPITRDTIMSTIPIFTRENPKK